MMLRVSYYAGVWCGVHRCVCVCVRVSQKFVWKRYKLPIQKVAKYGKSHCEHLSAMSGLGGAHRHLQNGNVNNTFTLQSNVKVIDEHPINVTQKLSVTQDMRHITVSQHTHTHN